MKYLQGLSKSKAVSYYCCTILYCKTEVLRSRNGLSEGFISVTKYNFHNCVICQNQKAKCSDCQTYTAWLVPTNFNCMWFIIDLRSIPWESDDILDVFTYLDLSMWSLKKLTPRDETILSATNHDICKLKHQGRQSSFYRSWYRSQIWRDILWLLLFMTVDVK